MKLIKNYSTGYYVSIFAVAMVLSYLFLNFLKHPVSILSIKELSGGHTILNLLPYYDSSTGYEHLLSYTPEALAIYQRVLLFDVFILIPIYLLFFCSGIIFYGNKLLKKNQNLAAFLSYIPVAAAVLNLIEDGIVYYLIQALPSELNDWMAFCGVITATKSSLITISLLFVLFSFLVDTIKNTMTLKVKTS